MIDSLKFEVLNGIATITLNRPEKLNAFTPEMLTAWIEAYRECRDNDGIKVVVLTGAGRGFCSGGDVSKMGDSADNSPLTTKTRLWTTIQALPQAIAEVDKPTLCAVNGVATGGGMDAALMCDIRIASESARFAETYVKIGLIPGAGGAWFLPRLVGPAKAMEMLITGGFVDAREALRIGLVNAVVADDKLMEETYGLAERIAANAPLSMRLIKRAMLQGMNIDLRTHLDQISSHMTVVRSSEDHVEAVAAFKEKRPAVFNGR